MLDQNKIQLFQNNLEQISIELKGDIEIMDRSLEFASKMKLGEEVKAISYYLEMAFIDLKKLQQKVDKFED
jgi:hypothetical protein